MLFRSVRATWGVVLMDCGSRVDDAVLAALRSADQVVIVTSPDLLALRDAARIRALLGRIGIAPEHEWLLLNQAGKGLAVEEIEEVLGVPVSATLPRDEQACERAITSGALIQEVAPHSALSRQIAGLWASLNGEKPARRGWRLPWMWGAA